MGSTTQDRDTEKHYPTTPDTKCPMPPGRGLPTVYSG